MLLLTVCLILFSTVQGAPQHKADICGYESCNQGKPGFINVHLVAHTHDDVGWLKTIDQYYYGARNNIQNAGVQYILDSVITELEKDPSRRFIYVETAFFWQWWSEQNEETRNLVKSLVSQGRLEFINGGWCMNDEATTHYADIIDQMSLGLMILNDTFGECGRPRVAWQIDPFGHSKEQASLAAQMGYDGLFFGRLDHEDKRKRQLDKTMEMLWTASDALGDAGSIFTGALHNLYMNPSGFCFDILCGDEPVIDDPESHDYNVVKRVDDFLKYCEASSVTYASNDILVTMGGDFTYMDANLWYKNMDKLIKYANARQGTGSRFNLFYSTPSCYLKALNDANKNWPVKTDDFFPYGSDPHSYWTGFFTSRPTLKYMVRQGSNLLQACKQMDSLMSVTGVPVSGEIQIMKEAMAVAQHHDAVSGTEKQHVADDYARRLHNGVVECENVVGSALKNLLPSSGQSLERPTSCPLLNISECAVSESNGQFVTHVYNSLSHTVDKFVRLPVTDGAYEVLDPLGVSIPVQLVALPTGVLNIPGRQSSATHELVFKAEALPPLGLKSYFVRRTTKSKRFFKSKHVMNRKKGQKADYVLSNENLSVVIDEVSGLIKSVTVDGSVILVHQQYLWYKSMNGDNGDATRRASGAYIFRPNGTEALSVAATATITGYQTGPLVHEIHQSFDSWVTQVIRVYQGQNHVEFDWIVGPIPVLDRTGKEIISRFTSPVNSNGAFYTDANGRQTVRRVRDSRETWDYTVTEPISGNYYPVNSYIYINDPFLQLTVVTDRSQGGSSLRDGELELMVHRRLLHDDAFGVDEELNENAFGRGLVARGTHYLALSTPQQAAKLFRTIALQSYRQPQILFSTSTLSFSQWTSSYRTEVQILARSLPLNVNLLTLEKLSNNKYLLRLEHMFDANGEDAELSQPVTVSLQDLFSGYSITSAEETVLGGNQYRSDSNRLLWNKQKANADTKNLRAVTDVTLNPMEIRTFVITLEPTSY